VTLIVGFAPGGINDISARVVGKHLGRFIPGNPTIVVQNLPGAGGLGAGNRLYNVAEKDGSVIAGLGRSVPQLAIQGAPNVSFDPQKFTWLGSLSAYTNDAYLLTVIARHPAKTIDDVNKPGMAVNLGTDRAGATNVSFSLIAKEVLGLQVNLVRGYQGAAPIFLAMQRGEVDGQVIGLSSILAGQRALWDGQGAAAAAAVRPAHPSAGIARCADRPRDRQGRQGQGAAGIRRAAVLHGAAVCGAAGSAARPRQGAAIGLHGDVPRPELRRRGQAARSRRQPDRRRENREPPGPRRHDAEGRDRSLQRDREEVKPPPLRPPRPSR
jgi:hypothetical protein